MLSYRLDTQVLSWVCLRTMDRWLSRKLCSTGAPDGMGSCEDDAVRKAYVYQGSDQSVTFYRSNIFELMNLKLMNLESSFFVCTILDLEPWWDALTHLLPRPAPMEDPKLLWGRLLNSLAFLETGLLLRQRYAFAVHNRELNMPTNTISSVSVLRSCGVRRQNFDLIPDYPWVHAIALASQASLLGTISIENLMEIVGACWCFYHWDIDFFRRCCPRQAYRWQDEVL